MLPLLSLVVLYCSITSRIVAFTLGSDTTSFSNFIMIDLMKVVTDATHQRVFGTNNPVIKMLAQFFGQVFGLVIQHFGVFMFNVQLYQSIKRRVFKAFPFGHFGIVQVNVIVLYHLFNYAVIRIIRLYHYLTLLTPYDRHDHLPALA
jgi:hypothetical protein